MHYKYLLGSFTRVGYRILLPEFYLMLHGLGCGKEQSHGSINLFVIIKRMNTHVHISSYIQHTYGPTYPYLMYISVYMRTYTPVHMSSLHIITHTIVNIYIYICMYDPEALWSITYHTTLSWLMYHILISATQIYRLNLRKQPTCLRPRESKHLYFHFPNFWINLFASLRSSWRVFWKVVLLPLLWLYL